MTSRPALWYNLFVKRDDREKYRGAEDLAESGEKVKAPRSRPQEKHPRAAAAKELE